MKNTFLSGQIVGRNEITSEVTIILLFIHMLLRRCLEEVQNWKNICATVMLEIFLVLNLILKKFSWLTLAEFTILHQPKQDLLALSVQSFLLSSVKTLYLMGKPLITVLPTFNGMA